jgi:hypothetical protein
MTTHAHSHSHISMVFVSSPVVLAYEPRPTSVDAGGKGLIGKGHYKRIATVSKLGESVKHFLTRVVI